MDLGATWFRALEAVGWPASPPDADSTTPCCDACILDRYGEQWLNRPMGSVWLRLRADVRLGWRTLAALALLLGLIGGVVLTAAAGARRTDTAYPRLLSWASRPQQRLVHHHQAPCPLHAVTDRDAQSHALRQETLPNRRLRTRSGLGRRWRSSAQIVQYRSAPPAA